MKANFKVPTGRFVFELTGEPKEIFKQAALVDDAFAEPCCGVCDSAYRFVVRTVQDNDYFELWCINPECRAKLEFGQAKKGGALFPRRKDRNGAYLPHGGWSKYEGSREPGE